MAPLSRAIGLAGAVVVGLAAGLSARGQGPAPSPMASPRDPSTAARSAGARDEAVARQVCAQCHAFPPPEILPRAGWTGTIYEMVGLTIAGTGAPAGVKVDPHFDVDAVERFYLSRAPAALPDPEPWPPVGSGADAFARHAVRVPGDAPAMIANVRFLDLEGRGAMDVVATDMANGAVLRARPGTGPASVLARITAPCHTAIVDLDRDGRLDLVVADLGAVPPSDHLKGAVTWLQRQGDGSYRARPLATGMPRVASAEPGDFDGDGDLDLAVAAFGWRTVGSLSLLENRTRDWSAPVFVPRTLDPRTGAIDVPVVDLDRDGRSDIVTVFAQHHETVVAFRHTAAGVRPETVHTAPHPGWGSSALEVADLDGDRDLDVVLSHGDMLDDFLLKPDHGLEWLENRGIYPFTAHTLPRLAGAMGVRAADLDGDGDRDLVAVTFVPDPRRSGDRPRPPLPSLVWLEQAKGGRFERHTLEVGGRHVSLDAADFDRDGDVDLVTGRFGPGPGADIEVWENLRRRN